MAKNKNKVFINKNVRYKGKKVPIFDRINRIKSDIKELLPEIEEDKFLSMMSHCKNYYYGRLFYGRANKPENQKKRDLTANEKIILNYLLENKLSPATTYRWFIACRMPSNIVDKLQKGKLGFRRAFLFADNRKKSKLSNTGLLMMEEINNTVSSL